MKRVVLALLMLGVAGGPSWAGPACEAVQAGHVTEALTEECSKEALAELVERGKEGPACRAYKKAMKDGQYDEHFRTPFFEQCMAEMDRRAGIKSTVTNCYEHEAGHTVCYSN